MKAPYLISKQVHPSPVQRVRRLLRVLTGQDAYIRRDWHIKYELLGNEGAAFAVAPDDLTANSIDYSFGIGTDIMFDLSLINRYGVQLHAFDPAPGSQKWLRSQTLPNNLRCHDYGVAATDGLIEFAVPCSPEHVSYTMVARYGLTRTIFARVRRLSSIMDDLCHKTIDLLKIDIDGAEYGVLRDVVSNQLPIRQICIEFHQRLLEIGPKSTQEAVRLLKNAGYKLFYVSPIGQEYSFLHQ